MDKIKLLICDLDGVLTDGYLYQTESGDEFRAFHVHDGQGIKLLIKSGIDVAVITTSTQNLIDRRMAQLGIKYFYKGQVDKTLAFNDLKLKLNLEDDEIAYIGDDIPDLPLIKQVGFGIAVADAVPLVLAHADWVTTKPGGHGAVREACELIMQEQGTYAQVI